MWEAWEIGAKRDEQLEEYMNKTLWRSERDRKYGRNVGQVLSIATGPRQHSGSWFPSGPVTKFVLSQRLSTCFETARRGGWQLLVIPPLLGNDWSGHSLTGPFLHIHTHTHSHVRWKRSVRISLQTKYLIWHGPHRKHRVQNFCCCVFLPQKYVYLSVAYQS
jgi:hypothetical protein